MATNTTDDDTTPPDGDPPARAGTVPGPERVWLITGASSGIGRALAHAVLEAGERVVLTARDTARLTDPVERFGSRALPVALEVTDPASVADAVAAALAAFGRIDVLVNAAGMTQAGAVEEVDDATCRALFDLNVHGLLEMTRAVLPELRARRGGHVLTVSSQSGHVGLGGNGIYSATKFAVEGLSEALAEELAPLGVAVTIVEPGMFATNLAGRMYRSEPIGDYQPIHDYLAAAEAAGAADPAAGGSGNDIGRAATAIRTAVDADRPPLRIALGSDCYDTVTTKLHGELEEYRAWEAVSRSVDA